LRVAESEKGRPRRQKKRNGADLSASPLFYIFVVREEVAITLKTGCFDAALIPVMT
jgi:hypothetical protein